MNQVIRRINIIRDCLQALPVKEINFNNPHPEPRAPEPWNFGTRNLLLSLTQQTTSCPSSSKTGSKRLPDYIVLPGSAHEVSAVVKLLNLHNIPYAARGNGSSVMGFVMSEGAVIDMARMKSIEFDEKNWLVKVGAGVAAFDLQKAASERGFRVNVAEPSALVCANIMCSGIFSLFSASYGTAADNYIDAEFVGPDGSIFRLSDKSAPNLFSFRKENAALPGICTTAWIKLHPVTSGEGAALVPFESLETALDFARDCATRRIGIAIGVLGGEYLSVFLSPTQKLASEVKDVFLQKLKIHYAVLVIGDQRGIQTHCRQPRAQERLWIYYPS